MRLGDVLSHLEPWMLKIPEWKQLQTRKETGKTGEWGSVWGKEGLTNIKVPCIHGQKWDESHYFPQLICINKTSKIIYKNVRGEKSREKFKVYRTIKFVGLDIENVIYKGKNWNIISSKQKKPFALWKNIQKRIKIYVIRQKNTQWMTHLSKSPPLKYA